MTHAKNDTGNTESKNLKVFEAYRRIGDPDDRFDAKFWQSLGPEAIFQAAFEMALDAIIMRDGHVDEPRLQRSVEVSGKS